jgi:hypothetical protein
MDTRVAERIEGITSVGAATILAVAVAYCTSRFAASAVTVGAGAAVALFVALQILRSIGSNKQALPLAPFEPVELIIEEWDELLLTEENRFDQVQSCVVPDELLLEDVLTELGDESRVVRLFDASAMPTPGQLKARIDRHLNQADARIAVDASDALHDALAELRRSLK